jgi:hypothetical protein
MAGDNEQLKMNLQIGADKFGSTATSLQGIKWEEAKMAYGDLLALLLQR